MRFCLLLWCLVSAQAFASFTVYVSDLNGNPVEDAVLALPSEQASDAVQSNEALPIAIMDQIDMQFNPHVLVVQKNQLVSFPNSDDTRHHVYSFSKPKIFELKLFKGTHSNPVQLDIPGIVELGCNIHDSMLGFIYVDEFGTASKTDASGRVMFDYDPPQVLTLWHPRLKHAKGELLQLSLANKNDKGEFTFSIDVGSDAPEAPASGFKRRFKRSHSEQDE